MTALRQCELVLPSCLDFVHQGVVVLLTTDKSGVFNTTAAEYGVDSMDTSIGEREGTVEDIRSMQRLGKEQLFKV